MQIVREFYKKPALIASNLTTTTGEPPAPGGMLKREGFCGNDTLRCEPGRALTVLIP